MHYVQLPLPGIGEEPIGEKLPTMTLVYLAHTGLRDHLSVIFDNEIAVLRAMGVLTEAQCSESVYLQQRKLCVAIRDLVSMLDDMNEAQEDDHNGE